MPYQYQFMYTHYLAEPMVEVFKTNVDKKQDAADLVQRLNAIFPAYKINFDMDDCDRILRVQTDDEAVYAEQIIATVRGAGFYCSVLEE